MSTTSSADASRKSVDLDGEGAAAAESTTYGYDSNQVWKETTNGGDRYYLYGHALDSVIARHDQTNGTGWYLTDQQGTIRDFVTATDSNHIEYDAFGGVVSQTNTSLDNHILYTGREYDAETDLYNYRTRYYDASTGRFISNDPLGVRADEPNAYRYVYNSPANATDPLGLTALISYSWQASLFTTGGKVSASGDATLHSPNMYEVSGATIGFFHGFGSTNLVFLGEFLGAANQGGNPMDQIEAIIARTQARVNEIKALLGLAATIDEKTGGKTPAGFIGAFRKGREGWSGNQSEIRILDPGRRRRGNEKPGKRSPTADSKAVRTSPSNV